MDNLVIRSSEKKLTEKDIVEFQEKYKINLPEDLIAFYKENNGGWPNADTSEGDEYSCLFQFFLPITYGDFTIEKKMTELIVENKEYFYKIIFGVNDSGATFHISVSSEDYGHVYINDGSWVYHCSSFTCFLRGLKQSKFWRKEFDPKTQKWIDDKNHIFYKP